MRASKTEKMADSTSVLVQTRQNAGHTRHGPDIEHANRSIEAMFPRLRNKIEQNTICEYNLRSF